MSILIFQESTDLTNVPTLTNLWKNDTRQFMNYERKSPKFSSDFKQRNKVIDIGFLHYVRLFQSSKG